MADTFICNFPGLNGTGSFQFMQIEKIGASLCHGFVRFDLSSIFVGSTIISADLTLFHVGYIDLGTSTFNITAFGTAVGWSEAGLSFDTWIRDDRDHPIVGSTEPTNLGTVGTNVTWNATALTDAWVNGGLRNHGFRLGGSPSDAAITNLGAKDRPDLDERPVLTVTLLRVVPEDPGAHPLAPFIVQLGVPVDLFLLVLGIVTLVLTYFGLFAAHYPEDFGGTKSPPLRERLRRFR